MDDPYAEAAAAAHADWVMQERADEWRHDTARQVRAAFIAGYGAGLAAIEHWDGDAQQAYERWREGM